MPTEGKHSEEKEEERMFDVIQDFCISDAFEKEFEEFAKKNFSVFEQSLDFSVHSSEHPLEFHRVYQEYLDKFEKMIEDHIVKSGYSINDFYNQCKQILEDEGVFGKKRLFIETMLATSEYESFFILMQSEVRLQKAASNHK